MKLYKKNSKALHQYYSEQGKKQMVVIECVSKMFFLVPTAI